MALARAGSAFDQPLILMLFGRDYSRRPILQDQKFSSKKELFFHLCNPILIDGVVRKWFVLDKFSGKKSYILSARKLSITWGNEPIYWNWTSIPQSRPYTNASMLILSHSLYRFSEVAVPKTIHLLAIQGKIRTRMPSPNTTYSAYLIMKTTENAYGLNSIPSETSIEVGSHVSSNKAYLCCCDSKKQQIDLLFFLYESGGSVEAEGEQRRGRTGPKVREKMDEEVKMSVMEVKGHNFKGGLIIEGIDFDHGNLHEVSSSFLHHFELFFFNLEFSSNFFSSLEFTIFKLKLSLSSNKRFFRPLNWRSEIGDWTVAGLDLRGFSFNCWCKQEIGMRMDFFYNGRVWQGLALKHFVHKDKLM
ncbi:hypothetical protein HYC85_010065 [Camellia sinensis]|uniref:Uncharacterized protein n=1 Tax=Camellia sinensis TaxID=4442 RepID=A0A7J7HIR5_CAMSI|nr:hypothetical protein HYC85_010065 [Camellia sinensis]